MVFVGASLHIQKSPSYLRLYSDTDYAIEVDTVNFGKPRPGRSPIETITLIYYSDSLQLKNVWNDAIVFHGVGSDIDIASDLDVSAVVLCNGIEKGTELLPKEGRTIRLELNIWVKNPYLNATITEIDFGILFYTNVGEVFFQARIDSVTLKPEFDISSVQKSTEPNKLYFDLQNTGYMPAHNVRITSSVAIIRFVNPDAIPPNPQYLENLELLRPNQRTLVVAYTDAERISVTVSSDEIQVVWEISV